MKSTLTKFAKNLRKNSTQAEKILWKHLRNRQLEGLKFRRQQPIGNYIVDFVCFEKWIIIEVDGGHHTLQTKKDLEKDDWLSQQSFKVLRFWNNDVLTNANGVLEEIRKHCLNSPSPTPPIKGGVT